MVGDGYCHDEANNLECGFDGGDCCYTCTSKINCTDCTCLTGNIWEDKSDSLNGNGYCNDESNNEECNYDDGDCCEDNVKKDHCSTCTCFYEWLCPNVQNVAIVGDGFCDDETNIDVCNYDGGDCCLLNKNIDHCKECNCFLQATCAAGFPPSSVGDGICHDEYNNADCKYDGGDCCLTDKNTAYCMECNCFQKETCSVWVHPLVQDGICNDETNIPECDFDGYDCCNNTVNLDLCSDCTCIGNLKL